MMWKPIPLHKAVEINPRSREWADLSPDTEVGFVPMAAISDSTASIREIETRQLSEVRKGYTPFRDDDVLFAKITPCMENGKAALAKNLPNNIGFGSTEFHVLRARDGILPQFVYYFVRQQTFRTDAKRRFRGAAGQQRVPEDFLTDYPFPFVSPREQNRIVELLEQADALRQKRAEADALADRILPALFHKLFGDPATNPKNFPRTKIGSVITETAYGTSVSSNTDTQGIPVLRMNNITSSGKLNLNDVKHVELDDAELRRHKLEAGDILFNRTNSRELVGKTGLWRGEMPAVAASYLIRVKVDRAQAYPEFVWAWLNTGFIKSQLFETARRAIGMANINATELRALPILLPPTPLQKKFVDCLEQLHMDSKRRVACRDSVEGLFKTMLHRAFTGELTAQWREAHLKELLAEMEQQAKQLNLKGETP